MEKKQIPQNLQTGDESLACNVSYDVFRLFSAVNLINLNYHRVSISFTKSWTVPAGQLY